MSRNPRRRFYYLVLLFVLFSLFCSCRKEQADSAQSKRNPGPLVVDAENFNYDADIRKEPGEVKKSGGYYMQECIHKSDISTQEWDSAVSFFAENMKLKKLDEIIDFEDREELAFITAMYQDTEGNYYVVGGGKLLILNAEGKTIAKQNYNSKKSENEIILCTIGEPIISDTGEIIFPIYNGDDYSVQIVSFEKKTGKERVLGNFEDKFFRTTLCAFRGSHLFYRSGDWIIDWDISSGEREQFFDLHQIGAQERKVIMSFDEEGIPRLYVGGYDYFSSYQYNENAKEEELVVILGSEPLKTELTISVSDWIGDWDNHLTASAIGSYQVTKPSVYFDYQATDEDRESYRTRVMAEIAGGKVPDILCVSRKDMRILWEKGLIVDLKELLSEQVLDTLLPGVLELGDIEGEMAGVPPLVSASMLITSKKNWDKDTWSMEKFMEQTKKQGKEYAWIGVKGSKGFSGAHEILIYAGIPSLEEMGLIDFQNGKAYLDNEKYVNMLEFCKEYGMKRDLGPDEFEECMQNRMTMGNMCGFMAGYIYFENTISLYGEEDYNLVGFPAGNTSCHYLDAPKYLVVSKKAAEDPAKLAEISDFLEYLLSEKGGQQMIQYYLSVLKPTEENCYEEKVDGGRVKVVFFGETIYSQELKADGSSYIEEYREALLHCRGKSELTSDLNQIILQEAGSFFEGTKSAKEAAEITQNRVQLYLDENR